ncbi:TetR/AcrR family transcriptional regulator [Deinococcus sonorensis]|uniref:TetR/AcrR family transcriptional regulator n=2 Tax=Deinococcus sonorensis TaxID=309891 RepID=A0AAU7U6U1_9DEIO
MPAKEPLHPQTRRHLVNSDRLRCSAIKEFALYGLTGAKVSNIVANAELTQPSFYRVWPSKEAAYHDIIENTAETWYSAAASMFHQDVAWTAENLLERIEYGINTLFTALTENMDLTTLVIRHQLNNPAERDTYLAIYDQGFDDLQQDGIIGQDIPSEVLAQAYLALTERFFVARLLNGQGSPLAVSREVAPLMVGILNSATSG